MPRSRKPENENLEIFTRALENLLRRIIRFLIGKVSLRKLNEMTRTIYVQEAEKKGSAERIGSDKDAEIVLLNGHAGRTVTDYAEKIAADCIIVGSHRPGMKDFFLDSTAARIMRYAPCSVHVLR